MKSTFLLLTGLVCLGAGGGLAQTDPHPDGIGIYFDDQGISNCVSGLAEGEYGPGFVFLLVTNPTFPEEEGITGWECELEITGPLTVLDWGLPPGAINAGVAPVFYVGLAELLPLANAIVLLDMTVALTGTDPVNFRIHPAPVWSFGPFPVYVWPSDVDGWVPLQQSTGLDPDGEPNVCAAINGECPVASASTTWGQLKALFR
jgi:hypothetical protein